MRIADVTITDGPESTAHKAGITEAGWLQVQWEEDGPWEFYPPNRVEVVKRLEDDDTAPDEGTQSPATPDAEPPEGSPGGEASTEASSPDSGEYEPAVDHGKAKQQLQKHFIELGIDPALVEVNGSGDELVLESKEDLDTDEGSAWRIFTDEHFGDDKPGNIDWSKWENKETGESGWYPEAFRLPAHMVSEVVG